MYLHGRGDVIRTVESAICQDGNHLLNFISIPMLFIASAYSIFIGCCFPLG